MKSGTEPHSASLSRTIRRKKNGCQNRLARYSTHRQAGLTTALGSCTEAVCNPTISTATNRLTTSGYSYDKNGNLVQDAEGKQFVYDAENHQIEVKNDQSITIGEYLYDGDGRRVKKISSTETTVFVYDAGGQLVAEYSTQTAQTPRISYLTTDHLGSPRVVTDANGAVIDRKDYTAFGEVNYTAERTQGLGYDGSAEETRKGYTGYEKDDESGLDFAQARYYNSIHGRFTSVDPLIASAQTANPQTFNRYSYVINDPLNLVDPYGLMPCSAEFSYSDCGGDSAFWSKSSDDFGDDRAFYDQTFRGMPDAAVRSLDLHLERVSNDAAGYGFITHDEVFTDIPFWIWWGTNPDGSVWTRFDFNINVRGSYARPRSGELNDNAKALIQEMGRWGPALQKTTTALMIVDGVIIAAPYVVEVATSAAASRVYSAVGKELKNVSVDGPSSGLRHGNGRVVGFRWKKSQWGIRLDLHPLSGDPTHTPVLHINIGGPGRGEAGHIPLFDPRWFRSKK